MKYQLTPLARICTGFGLLCSWFLAWCILFDVSLVEAGKWTISRWHLFLGQKYPWMPMGEGFLATLILWLLGGHLWWGVEGPRYPIVWALIGGIGGSLTGAYLGHVLFGQK